MKKNYIILFFLSFALKSYSQQPYINKIVNANWDSVYSEVSCFTPDSFIVSGGFISDMPFNGKAGFLIKSNKQGQVVNAALFDSLLIQRILALPDSGILLSGDTPSGGSILIKTDGQLNVRWVKKINYFIKSLKEFHNRYYIFFRESINATFPAIHVGIAKLDTSGVLIQQINFGEKPINNSGYNHWIDDAAFDSSGNMMVLLDNRNILTSGYTKLVIARLDTSLNLHWMKSIYHYLANSPTCIIKTADENFVFHGFFKTQYYGYDWAALAKIDKDGNIIFFKEYHIQNSANYFGSAWNNWKYLHELPNLSLMMTGSNYDTLNSSNNGSLIFRIDSLGEVLSSKLYHLPTENFSIYNAAAVFSDSLIAWTGSVISQPAVVSPFLLTTDLEGNAPCVSSSINVTDSVPSFTINLLADTVMSGYPFLITDTTWIVTPVNFQNIDFCSPASIESAVEESALSIIPNPATDKVMITAGNELINQKFIFNLFDATGRILLEFCISNTKTEIPVKNLSEGIYFVKVFNGKKSFCKKLIIEHD